MDNLIILTGEDKVRRFLQTLSDQEKIELIEEVEKMIKLKTLNLGMIHGIEKKPSIEYKFINDY